MRAIFLAALLANWPLGARAIILAGEITGGSVVGQGGTFIELDPGGAQVPIEIGADSFDDPNLYAFNEEQNVRSQSDIAVDIGRDIAAGELVASHYIAFDPVRGTVTARITFDAPIIGVATSTGALDASDHLANTGITYLNPKARGLEGRDTVFIDPNDLATLVLSLKATSPGDFVRVFTERSPGAMTPVPPTIWTFAAGLVGFLVMRRRRALGGRAASYHVPRFQR